MLTSGVSHVSKWYKTDLQIASPLGGFTMPSGDCSTPETRKIAAQEFVRHLKDSGLDIFAVTDHNSTNMLAEIREAAREVGIIMFPGMELSTGTGADGVHLILLGDPDADLDALTFEWLRIAGFTSDHPPFHGDEHVPAPRSFIDILNDLPEGTLAIAPHVLNDNGIASGRSVASASIKWQSLHHDKLSALDVGIPGTSAGWNEKFRARNLENFPVVKRIAYISTSDAYRVSDLGRHTWIRMHDPNLESLHQAFLDYEARIFCDWDNRLAGRDPNQVSHSYVESISLSDLSTSSEPLSIAFDPRITVIIGGRGSGKSTIIQGLRALYGTDSSLPATIETESAEYRNGVFSEATLSSHFLEAISGSRGKVTWTYVNGTVTEEGQKPIAVRVVSQKELFERTSGDRISHRQASSNMMSLVDEALEDDEVAARLFILGYDASKFRPVVVSETIQELSAAYVQCATARMDAERRLESRSRWLGELEAAKRKLGALDDEEAKSSLEGATSVIEDDKSISEFVWSMNEWVEAIQFLVDLTPPEFATEAASQAFSPLRDSAQQIAEFIESAVLDVHVAIDATEAIRGDTSSTYAQELATALNLATAYNARLEELGVDLSQYESLKVQYQTSEDEIREIDDLQSKFVSINSLESEAWVALNQVHELRTVIRREFASSVAGNLDSLEIHVEELLDPEQWKSNMRSAFGFRHGDHVDALEGLASWICDGSIRGADRYGRLKIWRDALLSNDYSSIEHFVTPQFVNRVSTRSETIRLQVAATRPDDRLEMRFLREGSDPAIQESWQSVENGSPGQRSAAMLAFVLSYGNSPLILDQPEDDLDSAWVSKLIVTQFRKARWTRQLIVVTHEANIPVNTDAERVISLESSDGILRIIGSDGSAHAGPLDDPNVREDIQNLLEGGVQAFVNRERRYDNELSRYRNDRTSMAQR
jgi:energy-coupling factor transporter ATP-binding protein EcfA2